MFRKMSLFVIVASFISANATENPTPESGIFSRMGTAIASAAKSVGNVIVAAVTPSTYTNAASSAWTSISTTTWADVKAAPGNAMTAMYNNPGKTALVVASAAAVTAAIYAYMHPEVLGFDNEDEDENITMSTRNKDKKATTYFIGQNQQ